MSRFGNPFAVLSLAAIQACVSVQALERTLSALLRHLQRIQVSDVHPVARPDFAATLDTLGARADANLGALIDELSTMQSLLTKLNARVRSSEDLTRFDVVPPWDRRSMTVDVEVERRDSHRRASDRA